MNYYELLNIERGADANTIKRAYFSAVKIHSPDRDPEGFKAIRLAYETLSDQKKRGEYDSYFVLSGDMQNKLLTAREMIRENRYNQAAEFLTKLTADDFYSEEQPTLFSSEFPSMFYTEARRLLAETLLHMGKSGNAKKICEGILKKNPSDADTLLLLANIAVSMEHTEKAGAHFEAAVNAAPLNARVWIAYMHFALSFAHEKVPGIFERATKQDINMFRDDYVLYLLGSYKLNLLSDKNYLQYYDKFAEFFLIDKNYGEEIYENLMEIIPHILEKDANLPFVEKILPALENSRHCKEGDEENFAAIHRTFAVYKLKSDKRIHDVLVDMTIFFLTEDTDQDELFGMEYFIVSELSDLRKSIKVLKNEYPDFFKLNQAFYLDVLNEKKENHLIDTYNAKYKKLKPLSKNNLLNNDYYDDFDDIDESTTIVRSSPKIGRNDPCPCGSGKKYKKCCGR